MNRIIAVFIIVSLFVCGFTVVPGAENCNNVFKYDNIEISFTDSNLDYSTKKMIADFIAEDVEPIGTYAINCLLGHSLASTTAAETEHNVYTDGYNCVHTLYEIEYCTRACGYMVKSVLYQERICDCHG